MHLSVKRFKKAQLFCGSAKPGFVFTAETFFEHLPACIVSSTLPTFDSCYVLSVAAKYKILMSCWIGVKFLNLHVQRISSYLHVQIVLHTKMHSLLITLLYLSCVL